LDKEDSIFNIKELEEMAKRKNDRQLPFNNEETISKIITSYNKLFSLKTAI